MALFRLDVISSPVICRHNFGGIAKGDGIIRNDSLAGHERTGADDTVFTNNSSV